MGMRSIANKCFTGKRDAVIRGRAESLSGVNRISGAGTGMSAGVGEPVTGGTLCLSLLH